MVLQVSEKTSILPVILINFSFEIHLIFNICWCAHKKRKLDHTSVNFTLIENINTVNYDL